MELGGRIWRARTSFGWATLRIFEPGRAATRSSGEREAPSALSAELSRAQLLNEFVSNLSELDAEGRELIEFFQVRGALEPQTGPTSADALRRAIDFQIFAGLAELTLEPFWAESLRELERSEGEMPPLEALPPPEKEASFIAANLLDQNGKPVVGRRFTIELPDGTLHSGLTDEEGWARVKGFTQDGSAKITFPDFDELDMITRNAAERIIIPVLGELEKEGEGTKEEASPEDALEEPLLPGLTFLDVEIVGPNGKPLAGRKYKLELSTGETEEGVLASDGRLKKRNIPPGSALVSLLPESGEPVDGALPPPAVTNVETSTFSVRVVSALGTPIVGLDMAFVFGAKTLFAATNEDGIAEVEGPREPPPSVHIADPLQLQSLISDAP